MSNESEGRIQVTLDLTTGAATDVLLAVEGFAERVYSSRSDDTDQQRRYNALADLVLPLRAARDEAIR